MNKKEPTNIHEVAIKELESAIKYRKRKIRLVAQGDTMYTKGDIKTWIQEILMIEDTIKYLTQSYTDES